MSDKERRPSTAGLFPNGSGPTEILRTLAEHTQTLVNLSVRRHDQQLADAYGNLRRGLLRLADDFEHEGGGRVNPAFDCGLPGLARGEGEDA